MEGLNAIGILGQLGAVSLLAAEMLAFAKLWPPYVTKANRELPADQFPTVDDVWQVEMEGSTSKAVFRFDAERGALLFRRRFGPVVGHRGSAVGMVTFDDGRPRLFWRPVPSSLPWIFGAGIVGGAAYFGVVEDEIGGAIALLVAGALLIPLGFWLLHYAGERCVEALVPELVDAMEGHLTE